MTRSDKQVDEIRAEMRACTLARENKALRKPIKLTGLNEDGRRAIAAHACDLVSVTITSRMCEHAF